MLVDFDTGKRRYLKLDLLEPYHKLSVRIDRIPVLKVLLASGTQITCVDRRKLGKVRPPVVLSVQYAHYELSSMWDLHHTTV